MQSLVKELEQFGLSESEARVYLAALTLGPASVQQLAQKAKLNRVTVYGLIESLIQKGFVREENMKGKRRFAAYSPMKLYDILGRQQDKLKRTEGHLEKLVPALKQLAGRTESKTNIIYYEGEEGLKNWASDALETKGELLEWTKIETFSEPFDDYLQSYYYPEKFKRQIPTRFIFLDTPEAHRYVQERYVEDPAASPMKARFISPQLFETPGFMVIFNNRYSIAIPSELRAVTVEDPLIADAQRKIWEFGWLHATDEMSNDKPYPKF